MKEAPEFERLFNPSSLAVIGASSNPHKSGGLFLKGLIDSGFKGNLYPVNPNEPEIMGLKSYRSVKEIPGGIDLAILAVPARIVPHVIAECSQQQVRFAIIHSAGFSELGTEGKELEEKMLYAARQGGTRIIGPNCMGIYSPGAHINTILSREKLPNAAGPVAFVGQSGWVTENVILMGYERGLRFSKVVSIGNQSDLTIEDLLKYLADDAETRVIAFYIEGIKRGRELLELSRQISRKKPIIIWKSGSSEAGARAAASHTGSLAGNNLVVKAALGQGGVITAQDLEELIDLMAGFVCPVLPAGKKVGLLVESGGGAVAGGDAIQTHHLEIPALSAETQQELVDTLTGIIPPFNRPINPVDIVWAPAGDDGKVYLDCARIMLKEVDAVVMVCYAAFSDYFVGETRELSESTGKPIFICPGHPSTIRPGMSRLNRHGIPAFYTPERAIRTLAAMIGYSEYRKRSP